jgi:8-oxo-dGTP pyrophosphatase MutT (NUDIX family)
MHLTAMGAKSFPQLRRLQGSGQVAAVCYRIGKSGVEFLLVQTGGGRWTFPKGNAEPGLSHAQSAALEAFEEAGVHGRMEEDFFARYVVPKRRGGPGTPVTTYAHLCEVARLEPPQEPKRNPTWFPAAKAKKRLYEDRGEEGGVEFVRVVDRAVARILRLRAARRADARPPRPDALQKVAFEASDGLGISNHLQAAAFAARSHRRDQTHAATILAVNSQPGKIRRRGNILQLMAPREADAQAILAPPTQERVRKP